MVGVAYYEGKNVHVGDSEDDAYNVVEVVDKERDGDDVLPCDVDYHLQLSNDDDDDDPLCQPQ